MMDQYHMSFMVKGRHMMGGCIMSSLTTCSGQGVVIQGKQKEKECVVKDIRDKSSHYPTVSGPLCLS